MTSTLTPPDDSYGSPLPADPSGGLGVDTADVLAHTPARTFNQGPVR